MKINYIKSFIKKHILGRPRLQFLFENLYHLSLVGMGYGNGSAIENSGELNVIKMFADYFKDRKVVILDVGANRGQYSLAVLNRLKNADLYAFEPSSVSFEKLKDNLSKYRNAHLYSMGLGSKKERVVLYGTPGGRMNSTFSECLDPEYLQLPNIEKEEIDMTTLDYFCRENKIENVGLLKLDIEGGEMDVLRGSKHMLDNNRISFIQFEFGATSMYSRLYFRDFFNLLSPQYDIYRVMSNGMAPINKYQERYEIFTVTNFLAVLKKINYN